MISSVASHSTSMASQYCVPILNKFWISLGSVQSLFGVLLSLLFPFCEIFGVRSLLFSNIMSCFVKCCFFFFLFFRYCFVQYLFQGHHYFVCFMKWFGDFFSGQVESLSCTLRGSCFPSSDINCQMHCKPAFQLSNVQCRESVSVNSPN